MKRRRKNWFAYKATDIQLEMVPTGTSQKEEGDVRTGKVQPFPVRRNLF